MSFEVTRVRVVSLSVADLAADAGPYLDALGVGGAGVGVSGDADGETSNIDGGTHGEQPTWAELHELQRFLRLGLTDLIADRDLSGESGATHVVPEPLRLTKGRVRTAAICPAQVLAEVNPFGINFNIAVGIVCDAAAGILALHPGFRPPDRFGWFEALRTSLDQEHPHLTEFVDGFGRSDRADFDHVVDDLCGALPDLLGDLRTHRPTVHHRIAHVPVAGVQITGEIDLSCDLSINGEVRGRLLTEVKSGRFNPRISDELAHYALITLLSQLPSPSGTDPTGGRPSGTDPTGGRPSGTDPTGGRPSGTDPTGGRPSGTDPTGGRPSDTDPTGGPNPPKPHAVAAGTLNQRAPSQSGGPNPPKPHAVAAGADWEGPPPLVIGCSISLADLAITPVTFGVEMLQTSARRLLDTAKGLLAIDETMRTGGRLPTNPGDHCRWCRRVADCGDAPDLVMAEVNESLRPLEPLTFDADYDASLHGGGLEDDFDESASYEQ